MSENIVVCLACCRPESFKIWYKKWKSLFDKHNADVIVSWDTDDKTPKTKGVTFIKRKDFPSYVPSKTSACRSAAVMSAYKKGYDIYIFLDDDVFPPTDGADPIQAYIQGFKLPQNASGYFDVGNEFLTPISFTRGFPYNERKITPVVAQYGGWDNVPDLDARDTRQLELTSGKPVKNYKFKRRVFAVPKHMGFTGCFMNCAFKHEVVPALYHLNMGTTKVGYDRFDDIWASLMMKRIADHMGWAVLINGEATCYHDRASDTVKSVFQEQVGHKFNEDLWDKLLRMELSDQMTFAQCYQRLTYCLPETQRDGAQEWIYDCERII